MIKFKKIYYTIKDFIIFSKLRSTFSLLSLLFQNIYLFFKKSLGIKKYILKLNKVIEDNNKETKTDISIWYMNITSHLAKPSLFAIVGVFIMKLCEFIGAEVKYIQCLSGFQYCHSGANPKSYKRKMPCYSCIKFNSTLYKGSKKLLFKRTDSKNQLDQINTISKLIGFQYKGLSVGKICIPSIKSILRTSKFSNNKEGIYHLKKAIESSITFIDWLDLEYKKSKPDKIVVFNGLHFNKAVLREWGLNKNIPVITFENGKSESTVEFSNELAVISGFDFINRKLNKIEEKTIHSFMESRIHGSNPPGQVTDFINWKKNSVDDFKKSFDSSKLIVSIFTNLDWDTAQAWSHDLFDSMWDWLDYLIPIMKQNEHTLFVIRAHPAEAYMVKKTFNTTKNWFYENKLDEYENIILIDSDTPYNSYELVKKSNFCLISNSTIGLEAQYLKTPALASSWVYYTNFDLVTKPKSLQEYKNVLNDWLAGNYQKLENYNFDKLYSYMYQYFFETEFTFEDYMKTIKVATMHLKINL